MNQDAAKKLAKIITKNPDKQYTVREVASKLNISRSQANDLLSMFKITFASVGKTLDFRNGDEAKYRNSKTKPPAPPATKKTSKKTSAVPILS